MIVVNNKPHLYSAYRGSKHKNEKRELINTSLSGENASNDKIINMNTCLHSVQIQLPSHRFVRVIFEIHLNRIDRNNEHADLIDFFFL